MFKQRRSNSGSTHPRGKNETFNTPSVWLATLILLNQLLSPSRRHCRDEREYAMCRPKTQYWAELLRGTLVALPVLKTPTIHRREVGLDEGSNIHTFGSTAEKKTSKDTKVLSDFVWQLFFSVNDCGGGKLALFLNSTGLLPLGGAKDHCNRQLSFSRPQWGWIRALLLQAK